MSGISAAPRHLRDYRGLHAGDTIVVCGCGRSLAELPEPERRITVGVNDVGRLFDPTYLVVLNPKRQFKSDRYRHVEATRARAVFTQLDLRLRHPRVVRFRLGQRSGTDLSDPDRLPYTRNSPYVALCLAAFLGAKRIGLIGVDFTDHHFFGRTGRHPLSRDLATIDREYRRLGEALAGRGVEVVNLSRESRLTAFSKRAPESWLEGVSTPAPVPAAVPAAVETRGTPEEAPAPRRLFLVHYPFLSCGDVFTRGLERAASELGLVCATASCKDPALPAKIERFAPDLLFVIHGRTFRQRHPDGLHRRFPSLHRSVWLLDEPYEVDDTETTSKLFDTVFINDPATLGRHGNAHYLPVAWDPGVHRPGSVERDLDVGFIGGGNPSRERMLDRLARAGLLSYVVGGPWRSPRLRKLCRSRNVPPAETVALYQRTRLVINVFRDRHHFNRRGVVATSLNPRVYEALACGALVISEHRPELDEVFPELPVFRSEEELETRVRELLEDDAARRELLAASRRRLDGHTYRNRLERVIEVTLGETRGAEREEVLVERDEPVAANGPGTEEAPTPTYNVLMVVHNGLPMTRLATLRTLRHLRDHDARLVVVDHGSDDGTETWLRLLARRGDLDLLRREDNPGHGPGLEQARAATRSPYLVTLDSDAFPLADDWLDRMRRRLDEGAEATGIGHYRGYIHPSCLMIARHTLDEMDLTFLDEKRLGPKSGPRRRRGSRGSHRLDVAERISVEIVERGGRLAPLEQLASQGRGSVSEPVDLGVEYGDSDGPLVHHQWYSTRAVCAGNAPVDDVPRERLDPSLEETLARHDAEDPELTVIVGVRAGERDTERRRNARAVLEALNLQDLERWRYRIVVVEQDAEPRLESVLGALADRWLDVENPGPYNRGWAFNVGAVRSGSGVLCLHDADLLPPRGFLRRALETIKDGTRAALPYREVIYLDEGSTREVLEAASEAIARDLESRPAPRWKGQRFETSQGGCLWIDADLYREIGGHDERFRGWGYEDREMWDRLSRITEVRVVPQTLLHLHHPSAPTDDVRARANHRLHRRLRRQPAPAEARPIGDPDRYREERTAVEDGETGAGSAGRRPWEHWHSWSPERLQEIVEEERTLEAGASSRERLARLVVGLGDSVLDLGCGPGALCARLDPANGPKWMGTDVTLGMLVTLRSLFPQAPVCQADAGRLPHGDGSFDVVVLRHVLEHLPDWLMEAALGEACRVARRGVVLAFHLPPHSERAGPRRTRTVGAGFVETAWTRKEIETPVERVGWRVARLDPAAGSAAHGDEIWVLQPRQAVSEAVAEAPGDAPGKGHPEHNGHEPFKISIVLPTFRRPELLPRTLATLRGQSYGNWEAIVVDNGGDVDPSGAVFDDPRIRVVRHTEKTSASYARNRGLSYVTGDLVCFFDDDDEMLPGYLAAFAEAFHVNPGAKMVRCGLILADGRTVYSNGTPECCLRREFATPTWGRDRLHDQVYFRRIVRRNRWSAARGDVVEVRRALVRAGAADHGGLRAGAY